MEIVYRDGKARAGRELVHGARREGARDSAEGQIIQVYNQCKNHIAHANDTVWRDQNPLQTVHYSQYTYKLLYYSNQSQYNTLPVVQSD
jgi:hypothetical protein